MKRVKWEMVGDDMNRRVFVGFEEAATGLSFVTCLARQLSPDGGSEPDDSATDDNDRIVGWHRHVCLMPQRSP